MFYSLVIISIQHPLVKRNSFLCLESFHRTTSSLESPISKNKKSYHSTFHGCHHYTRLNFAHVYFLSQNYVRRTFFYETFNIHNYLEIIHILRALPYSSRFPIRTITLSRQTKKIVSLSLIGKSVAKEAIYSTYYAELTFDNSIQLSSILIISKHDS